MSKISSALPITEQPGSYQVYNTFNLMGNEKIVHECTKEKKCCGSSDAYYTTLTDARLLIRKETTTCGSRRNYMDLSIFLRDIAEIRQSTVARDNCGCCACCLCCCWGAKIIELRGVFGEKILRVPEKDMENLQIEIPGLAGNHKLISHH